MPRGRHIVRAVAYRGGSEFVTTPGDQPRATLGGEIGPKPIERHDQPVAKANQKENVDSTPDQPSEDAAQTKPAKIHDRRFAPDRRQVPGMVR